LRTAQCNSNYHLERRLIESCVDELEPEVTISALTGSAPSSSSTILKALVLVAGWRIETTTTVPAGGDLGWLSRLTGGETVPDVGANDGVRGGEGI
jgi:hypothetical protein